MYCFPWVHFGKIWVTGIVSGFETIECPENTYIKRTSSRRPMDTLHERPRGSSYGRSIMYVGCKIERNWNLIWTHFWDVHETSPVRPNAYWDAFCSMKFDH